MALPAGIQMIHVSSCIWNIFLTEKLIQIGFKQLKDQAKRRSAVPLWDCNKSDNDYLCFNIATKGRKDKANPTVYNSPNSETGGYQSEEWSKTADSSNINKDPSKGLFCASIG
eukprot:13554840-Ditylum_brightwellii.AAC.1